MLFFTSIDARSAISSAPVAVASIPHFSEKYQLTSIEIFFNATTKARDEAKPACRRENIADLRPAITTCEIQILTDVTWGGN